MNWFDRKIDEFIRRIRDDPHINRIPIGPGGDADPTYWRYFVIRRNLFFNIYLHNFLKDDAEHHHDHRMLNISFLLQGSYYEERFAWRPIEGYPLPGTKLIPIRERGFKVRLPSTPHRVVLRRSAEGRRIPMWSLFIGFPQIRVWGFWTPQGEGGTAKWIPFYEYLEDSDPLPPVGTDGQR